MSVYAIADLHLSLNSEKPMDVFPGWEDYLTKLETNWRGMIQMEDTVVLPGDFSWAMSLEEAVRDFTFLESLPGRKILLKGNHDFWWATMRKMDQFLESHRFRSVTILHNNAAVAGKISICGTRGWFYEELQDSDRKIRMREAGRLEASVAAAEKTGLEPVAFLHYPPVFGGFECAEMLEVLRRHHIRRCYYGHLHGRSAFNAVEGDYQGIRMRLISADRLRFAPLLVEPDGI